MTQPAAPSRPTPMKRNAALLLFMLLGLAVAFVGCDTGDDQDDFDETVVGTWNVQTASVTLGTDLGSVSVPVYEMGDEGTLAITFGADEVFSFVAAGPLVIESSIPGVPTTEVLADGEGATITGDYAFAAGSGAVTFTPTAVETDGNVEPVTGVPATAVPIEFVEENEVTLTVENNDEGRALLTFLLQGQVPQEIIDAIRGGEITFTRN